MNADDLNEQDTLDAFLKLPRGNTNAPTLEEAKAAMGIERENEAAARREHKADPRSPEKLAALNAAEEKCRQARDAYNKIKREHAKAEEREKAKAKTKNIETMQAKTTRFVRTESEKLFGLVGVLRLNNRTGSVTIGGTVLDIDQAIWRARMNVTKIGPEAIVSTLHGDKALELTREDVHDAIVGVALDHAFDPIVEYLESLPPWDGKDRSWKMLDCLNLSTEDEPQPLDLYRAFLRRTAIGAVARAMQPGCKMDTICVLQASKGGEFKSTFWRLLFGGEDFFTDSQLDLDSKDAAMNLDRFWAAEWSEMGAMKSGASRERIKSFLSSNKDDYRRPYAKNPTSHRRRSVCVGSMNEATILKDDGGNRRFWIIPEVGKIDLDWVRANRDQVWAQALAEYRGGVQWWLTPEEEQIHDVQQQGNIQESPGTDEVRRYLAAHPGEVSATEILEAVTARAFSVRGEAVSAPKALRDIAAILRKLKFVLGKDSATRKNVWRPPT
jgi:virulence-associated protein E